MGLRCLIGHDYGEPRTSRDRRERGSEVVVTVREYRECTRCGHRRVISENKEVKAEPAGESPPDAMETTPEAEEPTPEPAVESTPTIDAEFGGATADEPMSAAEDDGIILEGEPDGPTRAHGQWPDADVDDDAAGDIEDDHDPWPNEADEVASGESITRSPDSARSDAGEEPASDESTADSDPESASPTETPTAAPSAQESRSTDAGSSRTETPSRPDADATELVCPECGETWPGRNASLRPGDICPECRAGYLDEQVLQ